MNESIATDQAVSKPQASASQSPIAPPGDVPAGQHHGQPPRRPPGGGSAAANPSPRPRMGLLDALILIVWTVLADWLIYRTEGYVGPALFFAGVPLMFFIGVTMPRRFHAQERIGGEERLLSIIARLIGSLLLCAVSLRLIWLGSAGTVASGFVLTLAIALASARVFPWAIETLLMPFRGTIDGVMWMFRHRIPKLRRNSPEKPPGAALTWLLPLVATVVFAGLFVLANPDLVEWVGRQLQTASDWTWQWVRRMDAWEFPFCVAALLLGAGLFHPRWSKRLIGGIDHAGDATAKQETFVFTAFQNTLLCLIALFGTYLVFEFATLWRRDFPAGFYYAGYAHQGAAWLTIALAVATGLLSLIFRGDTLSDPRLPRLKTLAWAWSLLNFLLAIAVYNRLAIYVGYNGLTTLRIVGFFGTTAVVVGFSMVVIKIALNKGFWWLVRTQITALTLCIIVYTIFPVDYVAHRYNAGRILDGYLHPSVMIAVKPKDDSGYLPMLSLVETQDAIIRDGVRALLAERQLEIEQRYDEGSWHWTMHQQATRTLYHRMREKESLWASYRRDSKPRDEAIRSFRAYAMRWY